MAGIAQADLLNRQGGGTMNGVMIFAEATNAVDSSAIGLSITSLLGSLGAAGAAVAVTYYFLIFLKDQSEKQNRLFEDFKDYHTESQKKFQDQLDRLSDRQEQSQRGFQDQVTRITEAQNLLLRDAILAMKAVEKSQDSATETIRGIEKTIASLQLAVGAIDMLVHRAIDMRPSSSSSKGSRSGASENGL
jgi:phosphoenolpyruvate-protein kinase (PTS system EI component)